MKRALFLLDAFEDIYGGEAAESIGQLVEVVAPPMRGDALARDAGLLNEAEIILGGWGTPSMDAAFLEAAPRLEAVFYGAGSLRGVVTDAFWERGIVICSAWEANAVPVAEFTLSQILFSLKRGHRSLRCFRETRDAGAAQHEVTISAGGYRSTVGLIGLGSIGRLVAQYLRPFDLEVLVCDPYAGQEELAKLGLKSASLEDVFKRCDVVSLHAPWLKETEGMITGSHFAAMKENASFINTARGALVRENEMIAALRTRPDLTAVLDVTYPEPPSVDSPLWDLGNVVLTPHIAGSMGNERRRMGQYVLEELQRYLNDEPLMWRVTRDRMKTMA